MDSHVICSNMIPGGPCAVVDIVIFALPLNSYSKCGGHTGTVGILIMVLHCHAEPYDTVSMVTI